MRRLKRAISRLARLALRGRAEREMNREIEAHLLLLREDFEGRGMSNEEAAAAARRAFGGVEQARELHREERSFLLIEQTFQDLRYAARGLLRSPGFTLVAVLTLALGIGVNTTLFTTYNAIALKPLPVSKPNQVFRLERWFESRAQSEIQYAFSLPEYDYCQAHGKALSHLVAASWILPVKGKAGEPKMKGQLVSANYFEELGIPLKSGRGFPQDAPADPVVVVSYRFWQRNLGRDSSAIGRTLTLNGAVFTIVGVTPEQFTGTSIYPEIPDFWAPVSMQTKLVPGQNWLHEPLHRELQVFARLRPSTPVGSAQAEADLLIHQYLKTYVDTDQTTAVTLQRTSYFPNTDDIRFRGLVGGAMLLLGLVLFVACVNVGNMLLARSAGRQREIGARLALGATHGRLIRQLLTENMLLSCLGGAAGLAASVWATRLLSIALTAFASRTGGDLGAVDLSVDSRVLTYVFAISICSGLLFGLSPSLQLTRRGAFTGQHRGSGLRTFLVGAQVAVSVLLLATAGLLARGVMRAQVADPGFDTRGLFVIPPDFNAFEVDAALAASRQKALVEKLRGRAEVAGVALGSVPFLGTWTPPITVGGAVRRTLASYASDSYSGVIGIAILRGRNFVTSEVSTNAPVALISESTARWLWPGEDPLGKRFGLDINFRGKIKSFEVIGVVRDIRFANLTRIDPAHVYLPGAGAFPGSVLLRLRGDRRRAVAGIEAELAEQSLVEDARLVNLDEVYVGTLRALSRGLAGFAALLATLAVALSGIGIYGVVSYLVGQRTKEIGIRMALGARSSAVLRNILLQPLRPVFAGMAVGIAIAASLSALLHQTLIFPGSMDLFYGVPFYDPVTFSSLFGFVVLLALVASLAPARRALRVDPVIALRYE